MTTDEAIAYIEARIDDYHHLYVDGFVSGELFAEEIEALYMAINALKDRVNAEDLIKKIKQLEPLNNKDCPEWVYKVIEGEK